MERFEAGPPKEAVVFAPEKIVEDSRADDSCPRSFGYFLTKSNSWRAGTARPKNREEGTYLIDCIPDQVRDDEVYVRWMVVVRP